MPGLVPGIHVFLTYCVKDVDGRDRPGHDEPEGALDRQSKIDIPGLRQTPFLA